MYRIYNRIFILILTLFAIQGVTLAINSEYKNSLEKVELQKTGDYSYDINLYMQKNCATPVKVVKKSDLSYYILLPETKNSSDSLTYTNKNSDIQNVKTSLFPYAGIDVNNGYTKIDINTNKPINFNLNIKNPSSNNVTSAKTSVTAQKRTETSIKKEENKIQTKNIVSSQHETKKTPENKVKEEAKTVISTKDNSKKIEKPILKGKKGISNEIKTAIKKTNETTARKARNTRKAIKQNYSDEEIIEQQAIIKPVEKPIEEEKEETPSTENYFEADKDLMAQADEVIEQEFAAAAKIPQISDVKTKTTYILKTISNKLASYGLGLFEVVLLFFTGLIGFIVMLFLMSNRQNASKLKRKKDLLNMSEKSSLTPKKDGSEKDKNNGQYFVFDKDVKQTGFIDPATSAIKKNYELSTYDPDINSNYNYNPISNNSSNESEYDIIQKILKEDIYVGLNSQQTALQEETEVKETPQKEKMVTNKAVTPSITSTDSGVIKEEETSVAEEPVVLSQAEIAPRRGLMLVSYNNNISLMGYIFDDVFALHNFKKSELSNYEIQCRLSEKDDRSNLYIVKVADEKMIIRVNNKEMKLEITL